MTILPIPPPIIARGRLFGNLNRQQIIVFPGDNSENNFNSKSDIISSTPKKQTVDFLRALHFVGPESSSSQTHEKFDLKKLMSTLRIAHEFF